jgi:hypothetical protein
MRPLNKYEFFDLQLVGIYEALKDDELRKSYHQVLEFGLPNWRQPMFYFRRARKLAIWQVGIILLGIVTVGQYLAAWGSYFEMKLSLVCNLHNFLQIVLIFQVQF